MNLKRQTVKINSLIAVLIAFAGISISKAQIVNIPDANFKAALVANVAINTNQDADIDSLEAFAYNGTINVANLGIADMTGIEAFANITILDCSGNPSMGGLNITNNTLLTHLYCQGNNITTLNTSNNLALIELNCFNNNMSLPNIGLNTNLQILNCAQNSILSLDLSALSSLSQLLCYASGITSLNIQNGNNINLTVFSASGNSFNCIQVDNVSYMNANWPSSIDATASYSTNCACTVNIPDANFKATLLANAAINTNSDGEIQCYEAAAYTGTINVVNHSINDLTGIEAFVNLTILDCSGNNLTSIDISYNTALTYLTCGQNPLTSLDVSNNTALIDISANDVNIGTLDVSNNIVLYSLQCPRAGITSITIGPNNHLVYVNLAQNGLTNLDFSNNTALTNLTCIVNPLTSLNLTGATSLSLLSLRQTNLNSLDLSTNTALTDLQCEDQYAGILSLDLSANHSLTILNCWNTGLTSLNIQNGNNTNLTGFAAYGNPNLTCIQVDDVTFMNTNWPSSIDAIANYSTNCACTVNIPDANFKTALLANTAININNDTEIQCYEATAFTGTINAGNIGIADITGIESFVNITGLYCDNNSFSSLDLSNNPALITLNCAANSNLTSVNVSNCTLLQTYIGYYNFALTSLYLSNCPALTSINCEQNALTSLSLPSSAPNLNSLDCAGNQLSGTLDMSIYPSLTNIVCGQNQFSSIIPSSAATSIACNYNPTLGTLDVSAASGLITLNCSDDGLTSLNVSGLTSLDHLECNSNQLSVLNLSTNTALTYLSCWTNFITSFDFSPNTALTYLSCGNQNNALTSLNIQNGNNNLLTLFGAGNNPSLTCIQVDNPAYSDTSSVWYKGTTASYSTSCACIVTIPDANFKTALLADASINTNGDNFIQCSEAAAYTGAINVAGFGIADLTGIEAFVNITGLNCHLNSLTHLDVSHNTLLTSLDCGENTSLFNLDVSANTALTSLICNFNGLTSLDVSQNVNLTTLICAWNSIPSLDISANTLLQNLSLENQMSAGFSTLDISANVNLQVVHCMQNSITNIIQSFNPNMFYLDCNTNQLTTLDLSLYPNLQNLYCTYNQFTSLNTASNPNLIDLGCGHNQITSLDVSNANNLHRLFADNNMLTSLNMRNGSNNLITEFTANSNPSLTCVQVDNPLYSDTAWAASVDTLVRFSGNCSCNAVYDTVNTIICSGTSITIGTNTYNTAGTYTDALFTIAGCDSILTTNLTIGNPLVVNTILSQTSCAADTIQFMGSASGGNGPLNYLWNTGAPTDSVRVAPITTSTYTLTVTDSVGCTGTTTATANVIASTDIYGNVTYSGGNVTSGTVVLYRYHSNYMVFDTAQIQPLDASGYYHFSSANHGGYLIKVFADSVLYPTLIPTYYGNPTSQFLWDSATVVTHSCNSLDTFNIVSLEPLTPAGSGLIQGSVIEGVNFTRNIGDPVPGADVKIGSNPGGAIIASTTTSQLTDNDGGGHFYFTNLPYGNYDVYVDIPGLFRDTVITVSLNATTPQAVQVNYVADSNQVYTSLPSCNVNTTVISHNDTLTVFRYGLGVSYQWYNCNGPVLLTGQTGRDFVASATGTYQVEINDFGCIATSSCYALGVIGINEENNNDEFTVAPNPFSLSTTITFNKEQTHTLITVTDVLGKEQKAYTLSGARSLKIEKGELNKGIYFIKIDKGEGAIQYRKIVIQ